MTSFFRHGSQPSLSHSHKSESLGDQIFEGLPPAFGKYVPNQQARSSGAFPQGAKNGRSHSARKAWDLRSFLDVRLGLVILWMFLLWWGEEAAFTGSVKACAWPNWESWVGPAESLCAVIVLVNIAGSPPTQIHTMWSFSPTLNL